MLRVYKKWPLALEQMWALMDMVWDEQDCDNRELDDEKISTYYRHPVWLLNGLFIESHELSMEHRDSISDWIVNHDIDSMLDYGGGFCTLSRMVNDKSSNITIDILEPFPSQVSRKIIEPCKQIRFVDEMPQVYDCIVALDVLEHVPDPLRILADMIKGTRLGGTLLIGNCFLPVIKCHLLQTFHFESSFQVIAEKMNLEFQGVVDNCHAHIYQKVSESPFRWWRIRRAEMLSKLNYRLRNTHPFVRKMVFRKL